MYSGLPGDLAIVLAFGMALLSGAAFLITAFGKKNLFDFGVKAFYLQIAFVTLAVAYLYYLFFSHDFSVAYVYGYSSSDLPFFYLLSAFWGGQEGTYLLWLFFSSIFGLILVWKGGRYRVMGMVVYTFVNLFLVIMLMTLSPFAPMKFAASEGAGLNPLLQDPWMVIHPPIMFIAYAMAGVPFALAIAAMIKRDYSEWLAKSIPYVVMTSLALAIANVLGGYWAYKTLGWGGYWAWDPVENTSLIPWLVSLGTIHGMLIEKRIGAMRRSNLLLAIFTFLLVAYGTFLTRSGVMADFSVHSFVDLGANAVLISFVAIYLIGALAVFFTANRGEIIGKPMNYNILSRDFILFAGMLLLFAFGIIVLFWSSLPFLTKYFSSTPSAAEPSTYNTFAFPLAIIFSLFLTLGPYVKDAASDKQADLKIRTAIGLIIGLVVGGVLFLTGLMNLTVAITALIYLFVLTIYIKSGDWFKKIIMALAIGILGIVIAVLVGVTNIAYLFFIGAASTAAAAQVIVLKNYWPDRVWHVGGHLTHFGYGLMILGILASSAFSSSKQLTIPRGQAKEAYGYDITYRGMRGDIMNHNNEILLLLQKGDKTFEAHPQYFYTRRMDGIMKRPFIEKRWMSDLYFSPQEIQETGGGHGLMLTKGETKTVGDSISITFKSFEIGSHASQGAMSVGAKLEVEYNGKVDTVTPVMVSDASGLAGGMTSEPVRLADGLDYEISLDHIYADNGMASFSIPGLIEAGAPDRLIMDVSKKPLINLLWIGAIVVFAGIFISFRRRLSN